MEEEGTRIAREDGIADLDNSSSEGLGDLAGERSSTASAVAAAVVKVLQTGEEGEPERMSVSTTVGSFLPSNETQLPLPHPETCSASKTNPSRPLQQSSPP